MSGIFGAMNASGTIDQTDALNRLSKWNDVYGDAKEVAIVDDTFCLGICADHITNAPVNYTPILHKDGNTAIIDALIYNRRELSDSFDIPLTLSDEEMLLELIVKFGPEHLQYVNGDFSGAVYSNDDKRLILFTDHMSVHPVFYYRSSDVAAFSTELRGLINLPAVPGNINPEYLFTKTCGYITSKLRDTEFADIFSVAPASYLCVTQTGSGLNYEEHKYWTLGSRKIKLASRKKYTEKMRELITESIKKRLDVFPGTVGAELSGGLDSGVIDILINRMGRDAVYYSWSYSADDFPITHELDERLIVQDICKQENITCNYRSLKYGESNRNLIGNHMKLGFSPVGLGDMAYKFAFPLYTNTEIICEASQLVSDKGAKVIFSGHGGDEGVSHRCDPFELYQYGEKLHFIKCLWDYNNGKKQRFIKTFRDYRYTVARSASYRNDPSIRESRRVPELLSGSFRDSFRDYKGTPYYFNFDPIKYIATGATFIRPFVTALFGPYSGARYVFPFLDYAVSIPRHLYINNCQKRYIYRQAFKDIMPTSLYESTNKAIFFSEGEIKEETDWFPKEHDRLIDAYQHLDKEYWSKYLDFDYIKAITEAEKPGPEGKSRYIAIADLLTDMCYFQHMVEVVKEL